MNKKLLLILLGIGLLVFGVSLFFVFKNKSSSTQEDEVIKEVEFKQRPFVSLTPSDDGHWLKLVIDKIVIAKAESLDYELLYSLPDGRTQGVPGTIKLEGAKKIERDLLLGSESSGKFRYDEGVTEGALTVRFRDSKGKLLAKFATKFHLQTKTDELTSVEDDFSYKMNKESDGWFVTMQTFGLPENEALVEVGNGPYGVFASDTEALKGNVSGWQVISSNLFYR